MKIYLDFSILGSEGSAFGRVSGVVDFVAVPPIGSSIVLSRPAKAIAPAYIGGFNGQLRVEDLRFEPSSVDVSIAASLESVVVASIDEARKVMKYLEEGFGLIGDEYESGST